MNERQFRTLGSYRSIISMLRDRGTPIALEAPAILERLENTVADIQTYATAQIIAGASCHVTNARRELERMRQKQMLPLARLARRVFAGESPIEAALRVPHKRAPTEVLLAAAVRMVSTLRPHRELLAGSRIDPVRIDELQREARRLKKVFAAAYASTADRAMPTRRLPQLFASARMDVLALDALIVAGGREVDLQQWKHSSRVGKRIGRPRAPRHRAVA